MRARESFARLLDVRRTAERTADLAGAAPGWVYFGGLDFRFKISDLRICGAAGTGGTRTARGTRLRWNGWARWGRESAADGASGWSQVAVSESGSVERVENR